jgi:hypothetical protein
VGNDVDYDVPNEIDEIVEQLLEALQDKVDVSAIESSRYTNTC